MQIIPKSIPKTLAALALSASMFSGQATAGAWTGGAWESTQWVNMLILTDSLVEQTTMAAKSIETAINTYKTYEKAVEDLVGLPSSVTQNMLRPLQNDLAAFYKLGAAVEELRASSEEMYEMTTRRTNDMRVMAEQGFDPRYFLSREMELAARNDEARRRYDEDVQIARENEERLRHFMDVAKAAPSTITSTVSGLHALNNTASLAVAEASETNRLLTMARVEASQERMNEARLKQEREAAELARRTRTKALNDSQYQDEIARARRGTTPPVLIGDTYTKP
jgi:hypothetical protein